MRHAILDLRPAEDAVLQPLGKQTKPSAVPEHQLDPVGAFRPKSAKILKGLNATLTKIMLATELNCAASV